MRGILKFFLAVALLGIAAFTVYMVQQDLDPLNLTDIKKATSSSKTALDKLPKLMDGTISDTKESVVYKRKDAHGNWYYTNEPPKDGEDSEQLIYRSDTNVLPKLPEDKK